MAQAIITKYMGPASTRGSRIIVTSWMGRTTWNVDHAMNSHENHLAAIDDHIKRKLPDFPWEVRAVAAGLKEGSKVAIIEGVKEWNDAVTAAQWDAE